MPPGRTVAQPFEEPCSRGIIASAELGREISPRRRRMVLVACVLASSMVFIDGSALTVALPRLRADFGGALADAHGKARMLAVGCMLFGLASAACALAMSAVWLIAARAVQGIAAAI